MILLHRLTLLMFSATALRTSTSLRALLVSVKKYFSDRIAGFSKQTSWLTDIITSLPTNAQFAFVGGFGTAGGYGASFSTGVRQYKLIKQIWNLTHICLIF